MKLTGLFSSKTMHGKRLIAWAALLALAGAIACNTGNKPLPQETVADPVAAPSDSPESCRAPVRYPNQDKPMALMMRQMADDAQRMRDHIGKGETITAEQFPFIRFHLVEPTDPDILQPQFFENARLFQESYRSLVHAGTEQQKGLYNAYIGRCISCHEHFCSGPLKRIRKLLL